MDVLSDDAARIADGLIRLSQVIRATISSTAVGWRLSPLQLEMLTLLSGREAGEPVGFLARRFMISDATVSDSLRVLQTKGLVTKTPRKDDARSVVVTITGAGHEVVSKSAVGIEKLHRIVSEWDGSRRSEVLPAVIELIEGLQKEDMVPVDRMCVACRYFAINCDLEGQSAPYYCRFFDVPLRALELRVDCPEFGP